MKIAFVVQSEVEIRIFWRLELNNEALMKQELFTFEYGEWIKQSFRRKMG